MDRDSLCVYSLLCRALVTGSWFPLGDPWSNHPEEDTFCINWYARHEWRLITKAKPLSLPYPPTPPPAPLASRCMRVGVDVIALYMQPIKGSQTAGSCRYCVRALFIMFTTKDSFVLFVGKLSDLYQRFTQASWFFFKRRLYASECICLVGYGDVRLLGLCDVRVWGVLLKCHSVKTQSAV